MKELNWIQLKEPCVSFITGTEMLISCPNQHDALFKGSFMPFNYITTFAKERREAVGLEARMWRLCADSTFYLYWYSPTGLFDRQAVLVWASKPVCVNSLSQKLHSELLFASVVHPIRTRKNLKLREFDLGRLNIDRRVFIGRLETALKRGFGSTNPPDLSNLLSLVL